MAEGCIFCQIVAGKTPADKVYEDDGLIAFHDIQPMAPVHILIIPRKHFGWRDDLSGEHEILGKMFEVAPQIADKLDVKESGYKLVVNCGLGHVDNHFHIHLIGGWGEEGVVVKV